MGVDCVLKWFESKKKSIVLVSEESGLRHRSLTKTSFIFIVKDVCSLLIRIHKMYILKRNKYKMF